MLRRLGLAAALMLCGFTARADDLPPACEKVKSLAPPAADVPDDAAKKSLGAACDSEAFYYGIGKPADAQKARACAFAEMGDDESAFGGQAMLMMIYANGRGAKRDLDLALHYACNVGGAPAELDGRIEHLTKLKTEKKSKDLDLCDDITSGMMMGICTAHSERIASAAREAKLAKLMSAWSDSDKAAWKDLRTAADAFFKARVENEVDLSGTGRAAFEIEEQAKLESDFLALLDSLEHGKSPAGVFATEDAALNATWKKLVHVENPEWGTVTKDGVKTAEKAWISYRDAWVAFAKKKYPAVASDKLSASLTHKRTAMLKALVDGT